MNLKGQCKIDFENWYTNVKEPDGNWYALVNFYGMVDVMQYGVYIEFFDDITNDGKGLFSTVFDYFYSIKEEYFVHNFIVHSALETCSSIYNDLIITK